MNATGMQGVRKVAEEQLALAQALCARVCHDLGGPVGSLITAIEIGPAGGAEAEALARSSLDSLRRRLRMFRALSGGSEGLSLPDLEDCLAGNLGHGRVRLDIGAVRPGATIAGPQVPCVLAAVLLAAEALPRGGVVSLGGDPELELLVVPQGLGVSWPTALLALLGRTDPMPALTPRSALAHYLCLAAEPGGYGLSVVLDPGQGGAALALLRLPGG
jgi:histidine phosphotransferase ChpT